MKLVVWKEVFVDCPLNFVFFCLNFMFGQICGECGYNFLRLCKFIYRLQSNFILNTGFGVSSRVTNFKLVAFSDSNHLYTISFIDFVSQIASNSSSSP